MIATSRKDSLPVFLPGSLVPQLPKLLKVNKQQQKGSYLCRKSDPAPIPKEGQITDLVMRVRSLRVRSGGYEISKNHVFSLFYAFVIKGSGLQPKTNQNNATSKLIGKN